MSPAPTLTPGSFCWFELATSDQNAAKRFYSDLFRWSIEDSPMGSPNDIYTTFRVKGKAAAAAYTLRQDQKAHGVPPNWLIYVLVKDADQAAARAKSLGGTILADPFDVAEHGRMAVIQDPTGASFAVWQPKAHAGIDITGVHGTGVWADLNTTDQARAAAFYSQLFGWKMVGSKAMEPVKIGDYYHIVNGTEFIGGVPPAGAAGPVPPHWLIYFDVDDLDKALSAVTSGGGRSMMPPMTMEGVRRFAVLADPQGAVFAVVQTLGKEGAKKAPAKPAAARATDARKAAKTPPPARKAPAKKVAGKNRAKTAPRKKAATRPRTRKAAGRKASARDKRR